MRNTFALCADDVILFLKDVENPLPLVLEERLIDMEIFQVINFNNRCDGNIGSINKVIFYKILQDTI